MIIFWVLVWAVTSSVWAGFFIVNPNEAKVLQLFGNYVGTVEGARPALGQPVLQQAPDLAARAQLRDRASSR